ncbi:hypothetical protein [Hypericibacter sp.]|uniref:hypothetical protein n=1 Tax=Hypericibacter sp. TaxID=2705401 RepID=UPI003D6CFAF7
MVRSILRIRAACAAANCCKSTFYERIGRGIYPKPMRMGSTGEASAWFEDEIELIQKALQADRDGKIEELLAARQAERGEIEPWLIALAAELRKKAA